MIRVRGRRAFPAGPMSSPCPGCDAVVLIDWRAGESGHEYVCGRCSWVGMLLRPRMSRSDRRAVAAHDRVVA